MINCYHPGKYIERGSLKIPMISIGDSGIFGMFLRSWQVILCGNFNHRKDLCFAFSLPYNDAYTLIILEL
jgi:hypothetical protein